LFRRYTGAYSYVFFVQFFITSCVVVVPTTLMGMSFPCLAAILRREMKTFGKDLGSYYARNTMGAIAGACLTGFWLIPWLGAQRTLALGVAINLLIGLAVLGLLAPAKSLRIGVAFAAASLVLILYPSWRAQVLISGVSIYPSKYLQAGSGSMEETLAQRASDQRQSGREYAHRRYGDTGQLGLHSHALAS
jgi:spermidine synthase